MRFFFGFSFPERCFVSERADGHPARAASHLEALGKPWTLRPDEFLAIRRRGRSSQHGRSCARPMDKPSRRKKMRSGVEFVVQTIQDAEKERSHSGELPGSSRCVNDESQSPDARRGDGVSCSMFLGGKFRSSRRVRICGPRGSRPGQNSLPVPTTGLPSWPAKAAHTSRTPGQFGFLGVRRVSEERPDKIVFPSRSVVYLILHGASPAGFGVEMFGKGK